MKVLSALLSSNGDYNTHNVEIPIVVTNRHVHPLGLRLLSIVLVLLNRDFHYYLLSTGSFPDSYLLNLMSRQTRPYPHQDLLPEYYFQHHLHIKSSIKSIKEYADTCEYSTVCHLFSIIFNEIFCTFYTY